jgi:hypothetical protein
MRLCNAHVLTSSRGTGFQPVGRVLAASGGTPPDSEAIAPAHDLKGPSRIDAAAVASDLDVSTRRAGRRTGLHGLETRATKKGEYTG